MLQYRRTVHNISSDSNAPVRKQTWLIIFFLAVIGYFYKHKEWRTDFKSCFNTSGDFLSLDAQSCSACKTYYRFYHHII